MQKYAPHIRPAIAALLGSMGLFGCAAPAARLPPSSSRRPLVGQAHGRHLAGRPRHGRRHCIRPANGKPARASPAALIDA